MEKIVKGATKIKLAAPKSKYIEPILSATNGGESGVAEIFRTLQLRLRDSTWTIVFKSLIVVHLMIREGQPEATLQYIGESPKRIAISSFTDVQTQGVNIRRYSEYLLERARAYRETQVDFVKSGSGKLKRLTIDKGLLRHTETVQDQIQALLRCDLLGDHDPENEITLTAFRLLTMDLLELYKVMNEATINILEHYFEMSRPDAERALNVYKTFGKQTDQVVQYLALARQYANSTRLEVPKLKHAPTTLTASLEEYLNDPDFEINRRQYMAQQEAKRTGKPLPTQQRASTEAPQRSNPDTSFPTTVTTRPVQPPPKGPAPDLIDFFESIEQNQQPMAQQAPVQQGYAPQYEQQQIQPQQTSYNPFLQNQFQAQAQQQPHQQFQQQPQQQFPQQPPQQFPQQPQQQFPQQSQQQFQQQPEPQFQQQPQTQPLQPDFTGAGFGGYGPQPQQQQHQFQSQLPSIPQNGVADFQSMQQVQSPPPLQSQQTIQPQQTSTNPFRQSSMPLEGAAHSIPTPTRSSTNPFARSNPPAPQQPSSTFSFDNNPSQSFGQNQSYSQPQQPQQNNSSFFTASPQIDQPQQSSSFSAATTLQPQPTGTNPFAKNRAPAPVSNPVVANVTGTNPFRQSAFVNQQTGQGWQHGHQGTFGGLNVGGVDTTPVFPRPGA